MTQVFKAIRSWQTFRSSLEGSVGFVPTMGALHDGHAALVERSMRENTHTVVSVFVNPTQFNDPKDLEKYPRTLEKDLTILNKVGCDYLLLPEYEQIYADGYRYRIQENELSRLLCGAHRPGHFDGVLTIVMKLLNIVQADKAYFGEKDYQQYLLIKGMAEAFFLRTEIVPCEIVRERDGLAMSSRNTRLSTDDRKRSASFPGLMRAAQGPDDARRALEQQGFEVDYIEDLFGRRLGAIRVGQVRLIDNVEI